VLKSSSAEKTEAKMLSFQSKLVIPGRPLGRARKS